MLGRLRAVCGALGAQYWRFFAAAFAFDLGTGLFLFLLSLYLIRQGFNEQSIGNFSAALTLGNLFGTLPATVVARRYGVQRLLLAAFICSPLVAAARVFTMGAEWQTALAFAQGVALCAWPICFAPAIAKLTTEANRSAGFSIVFATGIGMGTIAGLAGGWLPGLLLSHHLVHHDRNAMSGVLLMACALVLCGAWPLARLSLNERLASAGRRVRLLHPFLLRFLPPFLLWNVATGSFPVFGAIYLQNALGLPLAKVGTLFAASQLAQCAAVLVSPLIFRRAGTARGVAAAQIAAAGCMVLLAKVSGSSAPLVLYVLYSAFQFMCGPGIYKLLMDRVPEMERSTASAVQNACGAVCQAASAALTGFAIVHSGYATVLAANAVVAIGTGGLFFMLGARAATLDTDPIHDANAMREAHT